MPSGYKFALIDSSGNATSTMVDFDDMFVPKDMFLNSGIWAWGDNTYGDLGLGDRTSRSSPIQVGALTNWRYLNKGFVAQKGAIRTDGTLWVWGNNMYGALGLNNSTSYSSPVQVGALTNWKLVSFGYYNGAAIKTDGTLWMWGKNNYGQLGQNNITNYSSPVQVGSLTNWKLVSCGQYTTSAIKTDGTLWTWGRNDLGQLGLGDTTPCSSPVQVGSLTNWKQVYNGADFSAAIKTDGTLWTWGSDNVFGSFGSPIGILGLNALGSKSSPTQVGSLTNWKLVSCGRYHTMAIKTDGTLWTWGANIGWGSAPPGMLGLGNSSSDISSPVQVGSMTNWKSVICGSYHTLATKTDGTLWAWGRNQEGQLGLGDRTDRSSPVQVGALTNWVLISGGSYSTMVMQSPDL